jgi:hypothetical protein
LGESPEDFPSNEAHNDALIHAKVCGMADFYDIPDLKILARQRLNDALKGRWNINDLIEVLSLVCNLEWDTEFKEIITKTIASRPYLLEKAEIEAILYKNPSLAVALVRHAYKYKEANLH